MQLTGNDLQLKINNLTVNYDDLGSGDVPVIFIHGFPFDKSMWEPQLATLKSSYRVIAYDIRGFGKSTSDAEQSSISFYADDLIKLMDALEIRKAIVCGLSMGGYILLNALSRYPERFEAIILSDTQCIADSPEGKEKRYKTIVQIEKEGLTDFTEGFVKNIFYPDSLEQKKEQVEKIKNTILRTSSSTVIGTLKALAERSETCSTLDKISIPTLILCGDGDKITPLAQSEFMHEKVKNSVLFSIQKAGHMSNLEQPAEFNLHLKNFISGIIK